MIWLDPAAAPSGSGSANVGPSSSARVKLPTYAPLVNLPKPDLDGSADGLVEPGYLKYPANLIKSVPQPPGKGGQVNAITVSLSPAPTPLDQNPVQQQVNTELGAQLNIPSITTVDYPTRLSTSIAGSDLPDIIAVRASWTRLASARSAASTTSRVSPNS